MDWQNLLNLVYAFLKDPRVGTFFGLVVLDVLLGIAAAIRTKTFQWRRLADFYGTMVVPYVIGYLAFYLVAKVVAQDFLGPFGYLVGEGTIWAAWLTLVATLAESILSNIQELGYGLPKEE